MQDDTLSINLIHARCGLFASARSGRRCLVGLVALVTLVEHRLQLVHIDLPLPVLEL